MSDEYGVAKAHIEVAPIAENLRSRSIVIHRAADDLATQPAGAAGSRAACCFLTAPPALESPEAPSATVHTSRTTATCTVHLRAAHRVRIDRRCLHGTLVFDARSPHVADDASTNYSVSHDLLARASTPPYLACLLLTPEPAADATAFVVIADDGEHRNASQTLVFNTQAIANAQVGSAPFFIVRFRLQRAAQALPAASLFDGDTALIEAPPSNQTNITDFSVQFQLPAFDHCIM